MEKVDEVYYNLTGVNIAEQCQLWDERGKGYYGEFLLFRALYPQISGCCKILMNVEIPVSDNKKTEIDFLLVHETGLYVFEIKHYKGTIYGEGEQERWTQYFRTAPNVQFRNPIKQNQYHINALRKILPGVPIQSIIVFSNPECDLRIRNINPNIIVCKLQHISNVLKSLQYKNKCFDMQNIDRIFRQLVPYSPKLNKSVIVNGVEIPLYAYINTFKDDFNKQQKELEMMYLRKEKKIHSKQIWTLVLSVMFCCICFMGCIVGNRLYKTYANEQIAIAREEVTMAQSELSEFAKKYEKVELYNDGNLNFSNDLIAVSDVFVEESQDINNTVIVSFDITHTGVDYGVCINSDSSIIMILKDGSVIECPIYNEKYPYSMDIYMGVYLTRTVLPHEFYNVELDDIVYIKFANLDVWTSENYNRKIVMSGYEVEVYNKD